MSKIKLPENRLMSLEVSEEEKIERLRKALSDNNQELAIDLITEISNEKLEGLKFQRTLEFDSTKKFIQLSNFFDTPEQKEFSLSLLQGVMHTGLTDVTKYLITYKPNLIFVEHNSVKDTVGYRSYPELRISKVVELSDYVSEEIIDKMVEFWATKAPAVEAIKLLNSCLDNFTDIRKLMSAQIIASKLYSSMGDNPLATLKIKPLIDRVNEKCIQESMKIKKIEDLITKQSFLKAVLPVCDNGLSKHPMYDQEVCDIIKMFAPIEDFLLGVDTLSDITEL